MVNRFLRPLRDIGDLLVALDYLVEDGLSPNQMKRIDIVNKKARRKFKKTLRRCIYEVGNV